jgi:hypothetical protein
MVTTRSGRSNTHPVKPPAKRKSTAPLKPAKRKSVPARKSSTTKRKSSSTKRRRPTKTGSKTSSCHTIYRDTKTGKRFYIKFDKISGKFKKRTVRQQLYTRRRVTVS